MLIYLNHDRGSVEHGKLYLGADGVRFDSITLRPTMKLDAPLRHSLIPIRATRELASVMCGDLD